MIIFITKKFLPSIHVYERYLESISVIIWNYRIFLTNVNIHEYCVVRIIIIITLIFFFSDAYTFPFPLTFLLSLSPFFSNFFMCLCVGKIISSECRPAEGKRMHVHANACDLKTQDT